MNKLFKISFFILLLSMLSLPVISQNKTETGMMDSIPERPFNALDYSLQKRYTPPGKTFLNTRFTDNMYVTFHSGIEALVKRGDSGFGTGPNFGFTVGKHLTSQHSLRVTAITGWYNREAQDMELVNTGLHLTHLFNLSSYLYGYNSNRVFELSTLGGIGYQHSKLDNAKRNVGNLHFGLQLKVHPTRRMDILIEPRLSIYTDGIDHSSKRNWHGFDVGYGGTIGINYRFTPSGNDYDSNYLFEENALFDNTFLSVGTGAQIPLSGDILKGIGWYNSVGSNFNITGGKWIIPMLGIQLSLFSSFNKWGKKEEDYKYISSYNGTRIEGIINLLSFFNTDFYDSRFGLTGSIGLEWGRMKKETERYVDNIHNTYTGLTGSIQFKHYTTKNIGFFIESRFSQTPYPVYYVLEGIEKPIRSSHKDNLFSLNVGIELRRATQTQRIAYKNNRKNFQPFFFTGVNGGINLLLSQEKFNQNPGYQFGARAGRKFNYLSSIRTGIDYASYKYKENNTNSQLITLPVDYMFDLTNYIAGYNENRRLSLDFLAGMIFSIQTKPSDFQFGGEIGFVLSYKASDKIDIQLEPVLRLYNNKFIPDAALKRLNLIPYTTLGVSYRF